MNAKQVWQAALGELQLQLDRPSFNTWLKNTAIGAFDDGLVVIRVPNTFAREHLKNKFSGLIQRSLANVLGYPVQVEFTVVQSEELVGARAARGPALPETPADLEEDLELPAGGPAEVGRASAGGAARQLSLPRNASSPLNPRYVFERFIVGSGNRLAHAASLAVADAPAQSYNPLFIYGGVGLGKTHLLHAIGHRALAHRPDLSVMYVSSERFTNDIINAIQRSRTEDFRSRYRTVDILLIDDIQFIAGKEQTQEEFFHTFNSLHEVNRQIVISSDRPPKAILTLEDRLRSRFEGGLIADVQPPDLETRIAILRTKGEQQQIPIPSDVLDYIAHRIQSNIRELEGALNRIVAYAVLNRASLSVETASLALNDVLINTRRKQVTPARIINLVGSYFGVDIQALKGKTRTQEIVTPRQVAMYIIREETESSLADIGKELGGRDHTTVIHACEKIDREMNADPQMRQTVLNIRQMLYSEAP